MGYLAALIFDDQFKGEEARATLHQMASEGLLQIKDTVLIQNAPNGKISASQEDRLLTEGQKAGHVTGLIAASVTGTMTFVLAGRLTGRLVRRLMNHGITRKFIGNVKNEVKPGKSALIVSGESDPERRQVITERLQAFGGKVLETDIPPDVLQSIESEIESNRAA